MNKSVQTMDVYELEKHLKDNSVYLVDVREPHEYEIARIEQATLIPLSELEKRYTEIPQDKQVAVHCKMGGRSMRAIEYLISKGYDATRLFNVSGGITAWAESIDTDMPTY